MTHPDNTQSYEFRVWADAEVTRAEDNNNNEEKDQ